MANHAETDLLSRLVNTEKYSLCLSYIIPVITLIAGKVSMSIIFRIDIVNKCCAIKSFRAFRNSKWYDLYFANFCYKTGDRKKSFLVLSKGQATRSRDYPRKKGYFVILSHNNCTGFILIAFFYCTCAFIVIGLHSSFRMQGVAEQIRESK